MYSSYSVATAVCYVVFLVVAAAAVALRLRARHMKSLTYELDDDMSLLALV